MIIDINYDQLVKDYEESLHEKLRNFSTGHDFLETWVPDENLEQSLLGMFEAAHLYGLKEGLRIRLGLNNSRLLKEVRLRAQAREFGEARVELQGSDKVVHFQARDERRKSASGPAVEIQTQQVMDLDRQPPSTQPTADFGTHFPSRRIEEAHSAYQTALRKSAAATQYQGAPADDRDLRILSEAHSGSRLWLAVDKRHRIREARYESKGELEAALLEAFCELLRGLSLQEASEHGVLKLEYRLRDREIPLGIPGIITPENTDPMFQVPQTLIRALYFNNKEDGASDRNFWTDKVSGEWLSKTPEMRLAELREATAAFCHHQEIGTERISVEALQQDTRVIVRVHSTQHSLALLRLEEYLRVHVEPTLEVLLSERQDTNKPRENNSRPKDLSG